MKIKAAVIGCGRIGSKIADDPKASGVQSHAEAYVKAENIELVAVCDANVRAASDCAKRWGIKNFYTDIEALLEECQPELVSVCSPDATHAALLTRLSQASSVRGVLAEKPLALTSDEARNIGSAFDKASKILSVNYTRRFTTVFQNIKAAIADEKIGKITTVTGHYVKGIKHNGTHWIDLLRYLTGEVKSVIGMNPLRDASSDPTIDLYLEGVSGLRAALFAHDTRDFTIFEMDIVGTEGRIQILDGGERIKLYERRDSPFATGYTYLLETARQIEGDMRDAALMAVEDLARCVMNNATPRCSWHDGLKAIEISESAVKSATQLNAK